MRSRVEALLAGVAMATLAFLGLRSIRPAALPPMVQARDESIPALMRDWTPSPRGESLHVSLGRQVSPATLAWLQALSASGTGVSWSGDVPSVALEAYAEASPSGAVIVRVAGPDSARLIAGDLLGAVDSTRMAVRGAELRLPASQGRVRVNVAGQEIGRTTPRVEPRTVVVLGAAEWESRFAVAALEGEGWRVESRLRVGPESWVTQGRALPLDTARHGAVIVFGPVDPAAGRSVREFVRAGGGLILAGDARGLESIAPGRTGSLVRQVAGLSVPASRARLEYRPIVRLEPEASALDPAARGSRSAVRRVGAGRVVLLGDQETWRLSLASDAGRSEHALLWGRAVELVSPHQPATPEAGDDVAPLAALVAAFGEGRDVSSGGSRTLPWEGIAAGLLFVSLLAEWAARRMRGEA